MQSLSDVSQQSLPSQTDFFGDRERQGDTLPRTTQFCSHFGQQFRQTEQRWLGQSSLPLHRTVFSLSFSLS